MKKRKSFTLLEILVVTTIISLLGTVGFSSFNTTSKNSRDTKRKSDLESMKIGLSTYYQVKGEYPTQANIIWNTPLEEGIDNVYIDKIPQDPLSASGFTYYYQLADDGGYYICALLENVSGNNIEDTKCKSDNTECNYCTTVTGNYIASTKSVLPPPPACTPDCVGKCSGDNGCEGICPNNCTSGQTCTNDTCVTNIVQCTPDCVGKCGGASDGCNTGGTCSNPCSVVVTYAWSAWGTCSYTCGGGTQSRTCRGSDGITYDASYCSGSASQSCNTQACCTDGQMTQAQMTAKINGPSTSWTGNNSSYNLGSGSGYKKLYGDNNTYNIGGGSNVIDVIGNSNTISSGSGGNVFNIIGDDNIVADGGGGSNIFNFSGTNNTIYLDGGCISAYLKCGSLNGIASDEYGSSINGKSPITQTYTAQPCN